MSLLNALSHDMGLSIASTVTTASVSLSLVAFIGTILAHVYIIIRKKYGYNCANMVKRQEEEEQTILDLDKDVSNEHEMHSPARLVMRRESLIFTLIFSSLITLLLKFTIIYCLLYSSFIRHLISHFIFHVSL